MRSTQLQTFVHFYQALGYPVSRHIDFSNGVFIGQLLSSLESSQLSESQLISDKSIPGAPRANFILIQKEIQRWKSASADENDPANIDFI